MSVNKADGMNYAPQVKTKGAVVQKGEFIFAASHLDHGHIYGMVGGLTEAGGICKYVYDPDPAKVQAFLKANPDVKAVSNFEEILQNPEIHMVASAGIPNTRGPTGIKVMESGKDYFVDKCPFTTMAQLNDAKAAVERTGRKYMVYYSERLHSESSMYAGQLIQDGAIGKVMQVLGLGPHRLNLPSRPDWFFKKEQYGGILCDIGSHQCEQFLYYADAKDATVLHSKVGNYNNPDYPELEDFGDATLVADNGATQYFRVDWFTPNALPSWGDGRLFITGTKGYIEVRKSLNINTDDDRGDHVFLCNETDYLHTNVQGKVGCPFFGDLILDVLNRTEDAMTQAHAFKAAELCLLAQEKAVKIER
jgi:predicted dehydrogenase